MQNPISKEQKQELLDLIKSTELQLQNQAYGLGTVHGRPLFDYQGGMKQGLLKHLFWEKVPIAQISSVPGGDTNSKEGRIELNLLDYIKGLHQGKDQGETYVQEVDNSKVEIDLPAGFEWVEFSVTQPQCDEMTFVKELNELADFVFQNYGGLQDSFVGLKNYLKWQLAFKSDKALKGLVLGVRVSKSKKLVGLICGVPFSLNIRDSTIDTLDVKLMCVHKKYRTKRLSCLLMKELMRRAVVEADYEFGHVVSSSFIAKPFTSIAWYMTSALPEKEPKVSAKIREMENSDTIDVLALFKAHFKQYQVKQILSKYAVQKLLLHTTPKKEGLFSSLEDDPSRTIFTWVLEEGEEEKSIVGVVSFVYCPLNLGAGKACQLLYAFSSSKKVSKKKMVQLALQKAKEQGFSAVVMSDLMEGSLEVLSDDGFNFKPIPQRSNMLYTVNYNVPVTIAPQTVGYHVSLM